MSNNLSRTTVAASQNQKEVTINDADGVLDAAMTETVTIDVDSSDTATLTATQWTQNFTFLIDDAAGANAAITITVPATKRGIFQVLNTTAYNVTVEVSGQTETSPVIAAGEEAILTCDGSDVRQPAAGGGSGSGATDGRPHSKGPRLSLVRASRRLTTPKPS